MPWGRRYLLPLLGGGIILFVENYPPPPGNGSYTYYFFRNLVLFPLEEGQNEIVLDWLINFANKVEQSEIIVKFSGFRRMAAAQGPAVLSFTNGYQD